MNEQSAEQLIMDASEELAQSRPGELTALNALAMELLRKTAEYERSEQKLKSMKEEIRVLSEVDLPEKFQEVGLSEIVTHDGVTLSVSQKVKTYCAKAARPSVIKWLQQNGHGDVVKAVISVPFDRDSDEEQNELISLLSCHGFNYMNEQTVNPATLRKLIVDRLAAGQQVPSDLMSIYKFAETDIKFK